MSRWLVLVVLVLCNGCSSVGVYRQSDEVSKLSGKRVNDRQPGIPFYVKRAVVVHTTKQRTEEASVRFTVSFDNPKASYDFPSAGPITIHRNQCFDDAEKAALNALNAAAQLNLGGRTEVDQLLSALQSTFEACASDEARQVTVSNTWKTDTVLDPTPHWLDPKRPIIGSTTVSAELASDGTLTKASVAIQDDTLSTVLPLLPITKFFERRLGLADKPAAAKTDVMIQTIGKSMLAQRADEIRSEIKIAMKVDLTPTVYTLQKQIDGTEGRAPTCANSCPPLRLVANNEGFSAPEGVQLVSVETSSGAKKDDKDAYTLSGTISPPAKKDEGKQ